MRSFSERMDAVKDRVNSKVELTKEQVKNSSVGQFASGIKAAQKEKGFANKAKAIGKGAWNGAKKTALGKAIANSIERIKETAKKVAQFFQKNWAWLQWVIYGLLAAIALSEFIFFAVGVANSMGSTPHYYCNINAPEEEKQSARYKQYCLKDNFDNESIAAAAVSLATVDISGGNFSNDTSKRIRYTTNGMTDLEHYLSDSAYTPQIFISVVPRLINAMRDRIAPSTISPAGTFQYWATPPGQTPLYASCDFSICMAVLWSGADDDYPITLGRDLKPYGYNIQTQTGYLLHGTSGKWIALSPGDPILPGDIACRVSNGGENGHTWMYVAKWTPDGGWEDSDIVQAKYPGSHANRYEGSHQSYYACLSYTDKSPWQDYNAATTDEFYIFRFVGTRNEESPFLNITP